MLFPTVEFALFFVVVLLVGWSLHARPTLWQRALLLASALFYATWNYRYLPLLVLLALINQQLAARIARATDRAARRWLCVAVSIDLAALVLFKYLGFFMAAWVDACAWAGVRSSLRPVQWTLPLGVSFVTFQALSVAVDAYRARREPQPLPPLTPREVLLYVLFFPHLVAGPIVRATEFVPQTRAIIVPDRAARTRAYTLIAGGLAKKVVLATYLSRAVVDPVFAEPDAASYGEILAAIYGYAVQIYADFSGYTDMAIGLAALLGVRFPQNFDQPYRAQSLREFWRRWHMTLSRWLRDYLFVSLGGSREGRARTLRNLFLTMFLGGLWHGAAWTFVAWGALHGAGLCVERLVLGERERARGPIGGALATVFTFHVVCVGWVFFRASSVRDALTLLGRVARRATAPSPLAPVTPMLVAAIVAGLALHLLPPEWPAKLSARAARWHPAWVGLACAALLAAIDWLSPPGIAPFIYFQF